MDLARHTTHRGTLHPDAARRFAAELFDAHFDAVYRYCLSRTAHPAFAEDVAAQTFYEAARRLASDPTEPIDRPWLFVVAKRRIIDGWRRREREHDLERRVRALRPVDAAPNTGLDGDRVVRALASLPERQRRAVVLRYVDEQSVAEIADTLEVTYQAAESLLARGRRGFVRAWEELHDGPLD